ncbi:MAG: GDSL family lipase [Planctomycetaceae bacterium]|nr:GDSL family lipase [Planctomycetaceae bacterium]
MLHARHLLSITLATLFALSSLSAADDTKPADTKPATVLPVNRPQSGWEKRHELINERAKAGNVDVLFVGDSITQGWEGNAAAKVWEKYFGDLKPMNAGISGDRTQHVLWRLQNGNLENISPKLMVMMIGTNNAGSDSAADIAAGIKEIVKYYRDARPDSKVLLLAIFPRSEKPDERRAVVAEASKLAADVADGKMVHYLDIGEKFLQTDGTISKDIMPDFLHLSEAGYTIWAESITPKIKELLQ